MNDAFAALQRLRAAKIAAVAGVLPASARAPQPEVRTPVPVPNPSVVIPMPAPASAPVVANAVTALRKRAESSKGYVTESRRIAALPTWDYASMLARCQPGGDLDYTPRFRVPGGTMHLKPIQNLALYWIEQRRGLVGSLAVGSGKCVSGETEVYDVATGRRVRVDELPARLFVPSMEEGTGKLTTREATSFPSGEKPCVRLSLAGGQNLVLSTDHPVFTHRGWVEAGSIRYDDLVATPRHYPPPTTPLAITDEEVSAVAYLLANGGCSTPSTNFSDDNPVLVREFRDIVDDLSVPDVRQKKVGTSVLDPRGKNATYLKVYGMRAFVKKWDLNHLSKEKRVPAAFYGLSDEHTALFINRFWSSDGHITKARGALELVLSSEGLINDLQFMLLRLGIHARKSFKQATCVHKGERRFFPAWRLVVASAPEIEKFFLRVGLLFGQEEASKAALEKVRAVTTNTNVDIIPFSYAECTDMLDEMGVPETARTLKDKTALRRTPIRRGMGVTRGQYVGRETFARFCEEYSYAGKYAWLATNDLLWEKVLAVEEAGVRPVYDLSVDETHNFVANGVVIHNTLLSLLASQVLKAQRPILFIPPTMQIPLRREMEKLAKHFVMPKNLYIIPYSQLSVAKSSDLLEQIKPDLIICDEAHNARNPDAARTKRILRYANQFPSTRFVMLSGTLTSRSLKDYGHLCELALREGSPIPTEAADLLAWANCLDSGSVPQQKDWSIFAAFHDVRHINDEEKRKETARDAFRERLNATPGVVATREASVACSLNLYERALSVPPSVQDALRELHATWTRPDGEEMPSALDLWRLGMQISQGFYMKWAWPNGVVDWEWMNARSEWHRQVRRLLQDNVTGMDSPLLVWNAVSRGVVTDPIVVRAFQAWEAVKHRPPPPVETVWVDDFLVRDALAWLKEHPKGIVWHNDRATEIALREAGVPTYGAGEVPPLDGSKGGLALSIRVHGTGLNLQHAHSENLFMSFPSSGKTMEQLIGRTHRQGQEADEVGCWYYAHTTDTSMAVMRAREDARYIETTQGSPMKLNLCTWA